MTASDLSQFILKGGMMVAAMGGLDARAAMDIDATIKGTDVNVEAVEKIITEIVSVPLEDGVTFCIKQISGIMDEEVERPSDYLAKQGRGTCGGCDMSRPYTWTAFAKKHNK